MYVKIIDYKKINFFIMKYGKYFFILIKGVISLFGNLKYGIDGVKSILDGGGVNGGSLVGKFGGGLFRSGRVNWFWFGFDVEGVGVKFGGSFVGGLLGFER